MEPIKLANVAAANAKSRRLRELVRAPEILVMPGAYDVLSALLFEQMGFKAIQGTSGGIAAALGYPDGEVMSRDLFVDITGKFAAAVSVPVNADGERGYGDENEIKETVRRLIALGVAGMNLEDGAGGKPGGARGLVELSQQLQKIKAVMETKRALGSEFFLNARVDAFHAMTDDPKKALDEAIQRGNAYAEAGGDCIFYLFVHSSDIIGRLAKEVFADWGWRVPFWVSLALLLFSVYIFVLTPVLNSIIRTGEQEADMFGLNAARQPDGFAQAALHLSEYRKMEPGRLEEMLFFDHPSGRTRIFNAMRWKAEHPETWSH